MLSKQTRNLYIILSLLIVIPIGFLFKYYTGLAHEWFNDHAAAIFYEIFWCLFGFLFFRSRSTVTQITLWVFIITCILEFLQLWHPPVLEDIRATLIGKWLIGTTFDWWDFPHYALGCVLGWLWLRQLQKVTYAKKS
ncbi:DUF2809 domain-containing protein [Aetokthonos hydrillicola Thurmond2011]|jgi:hypothetical protein|uniref:DUF2809 domain-containing protein n=1 Tax=Aetokthonos hydrillicola Thurmond2011 TaxID=2712845 RepID=A0AAP5I8P7_9CYAN|nr:DUF2809 domain-containing protein [Aetokthonos hydrillicola]MBO3463631.1 DUF2809 domain-containing protein [Aetokthonos hydrillicola CCALA 1050]MBW4583672.1 DUF2809 domain-containing protein [Aetokthonos hydrillicola CCALA 1050]MDR9895632.1 DUF2809 domain-containing protein [Aetokthonos hydrillicola Thurmond2011]